MVNFLGFRKGKVARLILRHKATDWRTISKSQQNKSSEASNKEALGVLSSIRITGTFSRIRLETREVSKFHISQCLDVHLL
jgi:hypothetical protein